MTERDNMLARIREALTIPAPPPGFHQRTAAFSPRAAAQQARLWLPETGEGFSAWLELFAKNLAELKGALHICQDSAEAACRLREISVEENWRSLATHGAGIASALAATLGLPVISTDGGYATADLEQCSASITECDALVAQTGSVLVTSRSAGGRALTVLPPHHVVTARKEQLVPDLPSAYELLHRLYSSSWPSMIGLITGPSRTADIERILVLGAHGPKRLTIFLW